MVTIEIDNELECPHCKKMLVIVKDLAGRNQLSHKDELRPHIVTQGNETFRVV